MTATATDSVLAVFAEDHDRLDGLFAQFQSQKRANFLLAKAYFRDFKFGLQRHIVWEEQILFPLFERKTGLIHGGPTDVMRAEHRRIGDALEAIHKKVQQRDPDSDVEELALIDALAAHNEKEESILYPALDRLLTPDEAGVVFDQMAQIPESAYKTCCGHHG